MSIVIAVVLYSLFLVWLGRARSAHELSGYHDGGRQFSFWTVFVMVLGLWSSSVIVVQIDTGYDSGWSAVWYGISVGVMSILVSLLVPWFRRAQYLSNSDLLGARFGLRVRRLSALVIGMTFPIFAMSNALAQAAFFHVAFGWPLSISLVVTTLALIAALASGGMWSLAKTQGLNTGLVLAGLALAWLRFHQLAIPHVVVSKSFGSWFGIGQGLIWVWFGMNIINALSAQAEIQAVVNARDIRRGQWAVWTSTLVLLGVVFLSTWLGMQTREAFLNGRVEGLVAYAIVLLRHAPAWFQVAMAISTWALALTWCGPLLFSGAMSLGRDLFGIDRARLGTIIALAVEGALMVGYALWRPGEVAWWRVFGLTLRNAAVVGPTLAVWLWSDLSERAVLVSMLAGIGVGLGANAITGFSATHFVWGINPMWLAASVAFLVLAWWRLMERRRWEWLTLGILLYGVVSWGTVVQHWTAPAVAGIVLLLAALGEVALAWLATRPYAAPVAEEVPYYQSSQ
ncbi:MAG: sodium:solute symporter [Firmicutes bacterium]|nr:sodium:solute symporter [Bacillota bacterium]